MALRPDRENIVQLLLYPRGVTLINMLIVGWYSSTHVSDGRINAGVPAVKRFIETQYRANQAPGLILSSCPQPTLSR